MGKVKSMVVTGKNQEKKEYVKPFELEADDYRKMLIGIIGQGVKKFGFLQTHYMWDEAGKALAVSMNNMLNAMRAEDEKHSKEGDGEDGGKIPDSGAGCGLPERPEQLVKDTSEPGDK